MAAALRTLLLTIPDLADTRSTRSTVRPSRSLPTARRSEGERSSNGHSALVCTCRSRVSSYVVCPCVPCASYVLLYCMHVFRPRTIRHICVTASALLTATCPLPTAE